MPFGQLRDTIIPRYFADVQFCELGQLGVLVLPEISGKNRLFPLLTSMFLTVGQFELVRAVVTDAAADTSTGFQAEVVGDMMGWPWLKL